MRCIHKMTLALFIGTLMISGCSEDPGNGTKPPDQSPNTTGSDDVKQPTKPASSSTLPKHNPDAKYNGKGVLEYAEGLTDLNPSVQEQALKAISKFGVDGLPARDKLLALVESSAKPTIKVIALNVLAEMQAPGVQALVRQKIADPDFSDKDQDYRGLLRGAKELGIDEPTMRSDLLAIQKDKPAHAARLMRMGGLNASLQNELAKAIFESEHDEATTQFFMQNLMTLKFLDNEKRIAYIKANPAVASKQVRSLQPMLLQIGDRAAMDLTLDLMLRQGQGFPKQRYPVMIQFVVNGSVKPEVVMNDLTEKAKTATAQALIDEFTSYMDLLVRQLVQTERSKASQAISQELFDKKIDAATATERRRALTKALPGPRSEQAVALYSKAMSGLLADGPSDTHKALAVIRLSRLVSTTPGMKASDLAPAFDALVDTSTAEIVRGTAQREVPNVARGFLTRDPQGLIKVTIAAMWKCEDAIGAAPCEQVLAQLVRYPQHAEVIASTIRQDIDKHGDKLLETWGVNPIAAILMIVGGNTNYKANAIKTNASIAFGKVIASKKADMAYLQRKVNSGRGRVLAYNTVDGMIGIFEPTVFADFQTINHQFYPKQMASYLSLPNYFPAEVRTDEQAKARWRAFLEKVAAKNDPTWSAAAKAGLAKLN